MNLDDLYQEIILDHNAQPRHYGSLPKADRQARGFNPICGDEIIVEVELRGEIIKNISFHGESCAIGKASASMMTVMTQNQSIDNVLSLIKYFQDFVVGKRGEKDFENEDILALGGISNYPARVKCATLAWHTLAAALTNHSQIKIE